VLLRRHYDRRSGVVVHESMCACSVSVCAHLQQLGPPLVQCEHVHVRVRVRVRVRVKVRVKVQVR
jgi:hypothetical protein